MSDNTNALEEFKRTLDRTQKKIEDIDYGYIVYMQAYQKSVLVLNTQGAVNLADISKLNFEYDSGFGGQQLYGTIVFKDGSWFERGEYDGSEWWEYKSCPSRAYVEEQMRKHTRDNI